jgi:hypothetical protein
MIFAGWLRARFLVREKGRREGVFCEAEAKRRRWWAERDFGRDGRVFRR